MADDSRDTKRPATDGPGVGSPLALGARAVGTAWSTLKTVYYANSLSWRVLKSGALVFFGFFLWASSNVLYAYNPEWTILRYPMAYGFLLVGYGPVHHFVVLPLALRWRRRSGTRCRVGKRLPNAMLAVFLAAVVVLGTVPVGPVVVDFRSSLEGAGADVSPDLLCVKTTADDGTAVHCHLTESRGIDRVVVESGDSRLVVDDEPPFEFTVHERELESVMGEKRFTVVLLDEDGELVRQYTRRLSMVEEG